MKRNILKKCYCMVCILLLLLFIGCDSEEEISASVEVQETEVSIEKELETTESEEASVVQTVDENKEETLYTFIEEVDLDSNLIDYVDGYQPKRIFASTIIAEGKPNPFNVYDGYYTYTDSYSYGCYLKIENGILKILTRGEKAEDIESEFYIEDNKAYVELDGDVIQLGKKDMYTLEYTVVGSYSLSYLNYIDDAYLDIALFDIERIIGNEEAENKRLQEELEEKKRMEEEYQKDLEEQEKLEKEKKKNNSGTSSNDSGNGSGNSSGGFVPDPYGISYDEYGHEYYYGNRQYNEGDDDWDPDSMGKQ